MIDWYMDSAAAVECHIDTVCINKISYTEDIDLRNGLKKLLWMCGTYAASQGLQYNVKKSMFIGSGS